MRATDNRYAGERERFDLAMRMIGHEARTGTIRLLTGFTEDRIRKIYLTYFPGGSAGVRRRRGKSPTQVAPFVNSTRRQGEASLLASLFLHMEAAELDPAGKGQPLAHTEHRHTMGAKIAAHQNRIVPSNQLGQHAYARRHEPDPCGVNIDPVTLASIHDLGVAGDDRHPGRLRRFGHRLHDSPQQVQIESFFQNESCAEAQGLRPAHGQIIDRPMDGQAPMSPPGKNSGRTT